MRRWRVVDEERWNNAKLSLAFLSVLGMIAGAGGLEGNPEKALPYPLVFFASVFVAVLALSSSKPNR